MDDKKDMDRSFYRDEIDEMGADNYPLEDPMTFWNAEKQNFWKKMLGRSEAPFVLMGIGLIVIVIIFFVAFPRGNGNGVEKQVAADAAERMDQLDSRLDSLQEQVDTLFKMQQELDLIKKSISRFDETDASALIEIKGLAGKIESLEKELTEVRRGDSKVAAPSASSSSPAVSPKNVFHEVEKGDTLYSISRRYGVSVDSIQKLNGLAAGDTIQPGQKLKIK